jgi:hypothetical protein
VAGFPHEGEGRLGLIVPAESQGNQENISDMIAIYWFDCLAVGCNRLPTDTLVMQYRQNLLDLGI